MPRKQPTLHKVMRRILLQQPHQTATLQLLCEKNIRLDLYRQANGDGSHPPPYQFKLRTLHYPKFEFVTPDKVRYIGSDLSNVGTATKQAVSEIISEYATIADKVRALAKSNYDRGQISKILGIRVPACPNVLLRSGIEGGSSRNVEAEREPVEVDDSPAPREDTSWQVLIDAGFQYLCEWTLGTESGILLDKKGPSEPGVYSFVVDDVVVYVGLTLSGLRKRFDQYRRGHKRQRTSARTNDRISQILRKGGRVKVLVATPEPTEWQDLPVNTGPGLEAGLIEMIRPSWNIKGVR